MAEQQNNYWIIFSAENHTFACSMKEVIEIVRVTDLLPSTEPMPSVVGWINVRGDMVPVVDLVEHIFDKNHDYIHNEIIVLKTTGQTIGCVAERILAVSSPGQENELNHCFTDENSQFFKEITYLDSSNLKIMRQ